MTSSVINIRLPCNIKKKKCWNYDINLIQKEMEEKYNIWTFLRKFENVKYLRISCQIYNEMNEFIYLADIYDKLTKQ